MRLQSVLFYLKFRELPNHSCNGDTEGICSIEIRYNSINAAEDCCEACRSLLWLGTTEIGGDADNVNNPCLAWQIVDGKCNILRKKYFDDRYASDGLGLHPKGNVALSVPEVIDACAGFKDHQKCSRKDNSHGYWYVPLKTRHDML